MRCHFRGLAASREETDEGISSHYDDNLQIHPPLLCSLGAESDRDKYWAVFRRLTTGVYRHYKLERFLPLDEWGNTKFDVWLQEQKRTKKPRRA